MKQRPRKIINKVYSKVADNNFRSKQAKNSKQICILKSGEIIELTLKLNGSEARHGRMLFTKLGLAWKQI